MEFDVRGRFSNRCFPTKAVNLWRSALNDLDNVRVVVTYFHYAGFVEIQALDLVPNYMKLGVDPLYVVAGKRKKD